MRQKDKILSGALLVCFRLIAQPPAPGVPPPPGLPIGQELTGLFISGIILGIYWIHKQKLP